jgi:hypothetical protein
VLNVLMGVILLGLVRCVNILYAIYCAVYWVNAVTIYVIISSWVSVVIYCLLSQICTCVSSVCAPCLGSTWTA